MEDDWLRKGVLNASEGNFEIFRIGSKIHSKISQQANTEKRPIKNRKNNIETSRRYVKRDFDSGWEK